MNNSDLTDEQALAIRDYVISMEPIRLADLAHWMHDTAGPVDQMDASVDSLVPLWAWYLDFLDGGCPGVPSGARPEWVRRNVADPTSSDERLVLAWRALFAAESIEHYVLQVVRRFDPSARWSVFIDPASHKRGVANADDRSVAIEVSEPAYPAAPPFIVAPLTGGTNRALRAQRSIAQSEPVDARDAEWLKPESLRSVLVEYHFPKGLLPLAQEREASILTPLLHVPRIPWDAPKRQPPLWTGYVAAPDLPVSQQSDYGHWRVARRPPRNYEKQMSNGVEELSLFPPMNAEILAEGLNRLGFAGRGGEAVAVEALLAGTEFVHADVGLDVSAFSYEGTPRQLWIEGSGFTPKMREMKRAFTALGKSVKAELTEGY